MLFISHHGNDPTKYKKNRKNEPVSDDNEEFKDGQNQNDSNKMGIKQLKTLKEIRQTFASKEPKDFQKIRILGKGDVGRVYLVRLKSTEKLFAMKVLKQEEMIQRNKVKRVLTEREILATTNHPFIVSLYYSFQSRSRLYFVMDYCAGGEFYRTIQMQPHGCLTEDQVRFYSAEVLLALEYLHVMGFIYRDLKPENVLLHASGHIRLTDFDLSKASSTPVNAHVVQSMFDHSMAMVAEPSLVTNSFVGTEEYLAPEVIVGKGYGAPVDWWTFGILMYEMLYGVTPFRGADRHDTFNRIGKSQVKFPEHQRCSVSKECKNLIRKLLSHDPKRRLGSEQGAAEIRAHPFFNKITWALIRNQVPPIVPNLSGPEDLRYFSNRIIDDDQDEDLDAIDTSDLEANHPFKTFTTVDRELKAATQNMDRTIKREKDRAISKKVHTSSHNNQKSSSKRHAVTNGSSTTHTKKEHSKGSRKRSSLENNLSDWSKSRSGGLLSSSSDVIPDLHSKPNHG